LETVLKKSLCDKLHGEEIEYQGKKENGKEKKGRETIEKKTTMPITLSLHCKSPHIHHHPRD